MEVARFMANGQSTSAAHRSDLEDAVQNAEQAFVLRDYQRAFDLSSEVLSVASYLSMDSEGSDNCVCLQTSAVNVQLTEADLPNHSFIVRMSCDIALTDRAAVVALQSCYEMSDARNDTFLAW
jgi:hypothetical protein